MKLAIQQTLRRTTIFALCVVMSAALSLLNACGMAESLMGNRSGGTVSNLWPDVPPLDGASKAEIAMPLAFRLMLQGAFKGGIDYIAYTTSQTPDDVRGFYTVERMQANGWQAADMSGSTQDQLSCVGDTSDGGSAGALCLFAKQQGQQKLLLALVVAQNEQTKQTEVFYARIDVSKFETTPEPRRPSIEPLTPIAPITPLPSSLDVTTIDVCKAIPSAMVEQLLGRKLQGTPESFQYYDADVSSGCQWSAGKDASGEAYFAYAALLPAKDWNPSEVPLMGGIGDAAYYLNGPDARQLWVLANGKAIIVVGIGDRPDEEGLKHLAAQVIATLP
jgi:hypothetical protein